MQRLIAPLVLAAVLAIGGPAAAQVVLQPDAAPPGAGVVVSLIAANGGFTGAESVTTSCDDIIVGPTWLSDGAGNPASPVNNAVLSTVFFVLENAPPSDCTVAIDGAPLNPAGAIDNVFSIVLPLPGPVDGGAGDMDGAEDGVITVASTDRSDGGVVVFDALNVPAGKRLVFDASDPVPATGGNEAYMPIIVLIRGDAVIDGVVDASGEDGHAFGDNRLARSFNAQSGLDGGDGGHGGPGGGGGAAGGPHNTTQGGGNGGFAGTGGDGFGGGSGSPSIVFQKAPGGAGVAYPPVGVTGGNSPFNRGGGLPTSQVTNGGGGGAGNPFGTGGYGAPDGTNGGAAGYGGAGGAATGNGTESGGGGGGFATAGTPGGHGQTNGGRGGFANGLASLLPLMGGSGGGGGDGWITGGALGSGDIGGGGGGGGGGAFLFVAFGELSGSGSFLANGGGGGAAGGLNSAASGGGGGSGGGVFLAARQLTFGGDVAVHGGVGGINPNFPDAGGDGGEGRVRFDGGAPPTLTAGPTGTVGSVFQGCAVAAVADTVVTLRSAGSCDYVVLDIANNVVGTGTAGADGSVDLSAQFGEHGPLTVVLSSGGVPSPVGIARVVADSDGDSIPDFADADSDNDGIPDVEELGGLDLSGDDDKDGVPDFLDPDAVACLDIDNDGVCDAPPASIDADGDGVANFLDLDSDNDGIPDVVENGTAALDADRDGRLDDPEDLDFDGLAGVVDADDGDPLEIGSLAGVVHSDNDSVPDYLDLESDGDLFLDLLEAGGVDSDTNGIVDVLADPDMDGLAALVDPDENGTALPTPDDDSDGDFDFQDVCGDKRLSPGEVCDAGGDAGSATCGCDDQCTYPSGGTCDDGLFCTATDRCNGAGACAGVGDPCIGADAPWCDESAGTCEACLVAEHCAPDDDVCTATACEAGACVQRPLNLGVADDCDGVDNDCDGSTDEDFTATQVTCGVGACAGNTGTTACGDGAVTDDCDPKAGAVAEVCDGVDNDCDGQTDASTLDPSAAICAPLDTAILTGPDTVTASGEAAFTYLDTETNANTDFQCSLDGGAWFECDGGSYVATQVGEGSHTFLVRAQGPGGQVDTTPAFWVWIVDTSVPDTLVLVGPADPSQTDTATFVFGSSDPTVDTYFCVLDPSTEPPAADDFVECGAQHTVDALADGEHTLWVYAVNPAGTADPTPATWVWVVDTTFPETEVTAGPDSVTAASAAILDYADPTDDSLDAFRCRLNGSGWEPCNGGSRTYVSLTDGPYRFEVAAVDDSGNVDPTPASWLWVVDQTPPDTFVSAGPADPSQSATATFIFSSDEVPVTYRCVLDPAASPPGADAFGPCNSIVVFGSLAEGAHELWVQAVDEAGNVDPTPARWDWEVDTSAPETDITSGPPSLTASDAGAAFEFEDPNNATSEVFECSLDGGTWIRCDGGAASYADGDLALGEHLFQVRACESFGEGELRCDPTPAVWSWTKTDSPCPLDMIAPDVSCADDQLLECVSGAASADVSGFAATAQDACEPVDVSFEAPASFPLGTTPVVFQATDGNGNLAACLTRVIVADTAPPIITCPADINATTTPESCAVALVLDAPATDDVCDDNATLAVFDDAPEAFLPGETTVQFRAFDSSGNSADCQTVVTVIDDDPVTISCPETVTEAAAPNACHWEGSVSATVRDNCAPDATVLDETKAWPVGAASVLFETEDEAGNSASCTTELLVRDMTAPTVSCGEVIGEGPATATASGDDACGVTVSVVDLACETVDADGVATALALADCPVTTQGATVSVATGVVGAELRVSWMATAIDPSDNGATADCGLTLAALEDTSGPDFTGVTAEGGGGCQGGPASAPWWLLMGIVAALWLSRRRSPSSLTGPQL